MLGWLQEDEGPAAAWPPALTGPTSCRAALRVKLKRWQTCAAWPGCFILSEQAARRHSGASMEHWAAQRQQMGWRRQHWSLGAQAHLPIELPHT